MPNFDCGHRGGIIPGGLVLENSNMENEIVSAATAEKPNDVPLIPWGWILAAYRLQPACLLIALALWQRHVRSGGAGFQMRMRTLAQFLGVSYRTVQRGIDAMRKAGMIGIDYRLGQSHAYTVRADAGASGGNTALPSLE